MSHLKGKSVKELRQLCEAKGLAFNKLKKDELIALLVEHEAKDQPNTNESNSDGTVIDQLSDDDDNDEIHVANGSSHGNIHTSSESSVDESESVLTLRLKLRLAELELAKQERMWEIDQERHKLTIETGGSCTPDGKIRGLDINRLLPTMSGDDALGFFHTSETSMTLNNIYRSL